MFAVLNALAWILFLGLALYGTKALIEDLQVWVLRRHTDPFVERDSPETDPLEGEGGFEADIYSKVHVGQIGKYDANGEWVPASMADIEMIAAALQARLDRARGLRGS